MEANTFDYKPSYFEVLSSMAVKYERKQSWRNAALLWSKASQQAINPLNVHWSIARAEYCGHQVSEQSENNFLRKSFCQVKKVNEECNIF